MDELTKNGLIDLNRKETIYSKGFDMLSGGRLLDYRTANNEFKKIKVGVKNLDDAVLDLGSIKRYAPKTLPFGDKSFFYRALAENNYKVLREFSRFFYKCDGIY